MRTTMSVGVHSEAGTLRSVLVCRPGLAHRRLTPSGCHGLLFDSVLWVEKAMEDHARFVELLQERGVDAAVTPGGIIPFTS